MKKQKPKDELLTDGSFRYEPNMVVRDGHLIRHSTTETPYENSLSNYIERLQEIDQELTDAKISVSEGQYGDGPTVYINGFREMTPAELKKAEKLRVKTAELEAERQSKSEEYERKQLEVLKAKYEK